MEGSYIGQGWGGKWPQKNDQNKIKSKVNNQKGLTIVQCGLMQGQELDEKMQPIPWIEQPAGAFVSASSLWS